MTEQTEGAEVEALRAEVREWIETAQKFCDDYHAELDRRIEAEQKAAAAEARGAQAVLAAVEALPPSKRVGTGYQWALTAARAAAGGGE